MRRIVLWAAATVTALVLLFSYHTSTSSTSTATAQVAGASATSSSTPGSTPAQEDETDSGSSASRTSTYAGDAVSTRFGNVQVQITVTDGKITAVTVLQIPNQDRHDVQINNRAVPILNAAAVAAQSADIDMVSGATVTSEAYIESLQSALDEAHL